MHLVTSMTMKPKTKQTNGGLAGWILDAVGEWKARSGRGSHPRKHMRIVETLAVGPRKQLVLVSCDGERFLIGMGADNIGTITRVRPEAASRAAEVSAR